MTETLHVVGNFDNLDFSPYPKVLKKEINSNSLTVITDKLTESERQELSNYISGKKINLKEEYAKLTTTEQKIAYFEKMFGLK